MNQKLVSHYVFDDGSINSKVLQFEIKDAEVIEVKPYTKLEDWLTAIPIKDNEEIQKIFLHFCSGDLIRQDVDIRTDVMEAQHKYPNMRIILQYEQMDRQTIENRARKYGITTNTMTYNTKTNVATKQQDVEVDKILEDNKDKIKIIDYSKYAVGGNDTVVPGPAQIPEKPEFPSFQVDKDPFANKSNWFKDRRRRKKKE